jgi:hypothetical protein
MARKIEGSKFELISVLQLTLTTDTENCPAGVSGRSAFNVRRSAFGVR